MPILGKTLLIIRRQNCSAWAKPELFFSHHLNLNETEIFIKESTRDCLILLCLRRDWEDITLNFGQDQDKKKSLGVLFTKPRQEPTLNGEKDWTFGLISLKTRHPGKDEYKKRLSKIATR